MRLLFFCEIAELILKVYLNMVLVINWHPTKNKKTIFWVVHMPNTRSGCQIRFKTFANSMINFESLFHYGDQHEWVPPKRTQAFGDEHAETEINVSNSIEFVRELAKCIFEVFIIMVTNINWFPMETHGFRWLTCGNLDGGVKFSWFFLRSSRIDFESLCRYGNRDNIFPKIKSKRAVVNMEKTGYECQIQLMFFANS